jgi:hypothetical protein
VLPALTNLNQPAATLLGLLGAGSSQNARNLPSRTWEAAVALALRHGVAPLLHRRLQAEGMLDMVAPTVVDRLEKARRATALDNLRMYGDFKRVAHALGEAGIPLIVLKGLHLAELVYRDISLRPMADLDILVPREQLRRALAALSARGYRHNEMLVASEQAMSGLKEITAIRAASGTSVDVHWGLNTIREPIADSLQEIWRCARPVRLGDSDTLAMPPELLLVYVCAHYACANCFVSDARSLCDVAEIVRTEPALDWQAVVMHGSRHGWTRGVAAALRLARDHLGVPVPAPVLAALGGDVLDPALLADAIAQLFTTTELPERLTTAPNLLALTGSKSPRQKTALLWRRALPRQAELSLLYGVPADSARLPFYYALRLRDLAYRYAASVWALIAGDPALAAAAARRARLRDWVSKT